MLTGWIVKAKAKAVNQVVDRITAKAAVKDRDRVKARIDEIDSTFVL